MTRNSPKDINGDIKHPRDYRTSEQLQDNTKVLCLRTVSDSGINKTGRLEEGR